MEPASSAAIAANASGNASRRSGSLVFACAGSDVREASTSRGTAGAQAERARSLAREGSATFHLGGVALDRLRLTAEEPSMADAKNLVLGIDVGGTKVLAGVIDEKWKVLGRGKVKSPFRG